MSNGDYMLPPGWEEKVDAQGRTFYIDHVKFILIKFFFIKPIALNRIQELRLGQGLPFKVSLQASTVIQQYLRSKSVFDCYHSRSNADRGKSSLYEIWIYGC